MVCQKKQGNPTEKQGYTLAAKTLTKNSLLNKYFGAINFVKITKACLTKQITLKPEKITYINFVVGITFQRNYISVTRNIFYNLLLENYIHVFVCDSEKYMEKLFGTFWGEKYHFNYINEHFRNQFRYNSGWGVHRSIFVNDNCDPGGPRGMLGETSPATAWKGGSK